LQLEDDSEPSPNPLRRILWFDPVPGSSDNELAALRQLLQVTVTATREHAMALIAAGEIDAVVINEMRGHPDLSAPPPGLNTLFGVDDVVASKHPPVFVYIAESLARAYGPQIDPTKATVVTSFGELVGALRLVEGAALELFARTVAARQGELVPFSPDQGVDVLVNLPNGERVGIEVSSWLKRPQMATFTDRARTLIDGLQRGAFTRGILLARPELIDKRRSDWALEHQIEVVGPDELEAALDRPARDPSRSHRYR
jgi:hypothetical protein